MYFHKYCSTLTKICRRLGVFMSYPCSNVYPQVHKKISNTNMKHEYHMCLLECTDKVEIVLIIPTQKAFDAFLFKSYLHTLCAFKRRTLEDVNRYFGDRAVQTVHTLIPLHTKAYL